MVLKGEIHDEIASSGAFATVIGHAIKDDEPDSREDPVCKAPSRFQLGWPAGSMC